MAGELALLHAVRRGRRVRGGHWQKGAETPKSIAGNAKTEEWRLSISRPNSVPLSSHPSPRHFGSNQPARLIFPRHPNTRCRHRLVLRASAGLSLSRSSRSVRGNGLARFDRPRMLTASFTRGKLTRAAVSTFIHSHGQWPRRLGQNEVQTLGSRPIARALSLTLNVDPVNAA
jgi:hypothetical protein